MNELIVVIGSNDGIRVFNGHLGDSKKFYIYKVMRKGGWSLLREIENTFPEEKVHGGPEKMKNVLSLIGNVDILVSKKNSPNFKKIAATKPIQPVRVLGETMEEALNAIVENFELLSSMIEKRRKGFREENIPRLGKPS